MPTSTPDPKVKAPPTALDTLEVAFRLLATGPKPLALDGRRLGHGLPARPVPLDELRSLLLHPSTSFAARDAAVAELLRCAQRQRGAWLVGLAGVLTPGLRRIARQLANAYPGEQADIDAEVLTGFLEGLDRVHPGGRSLARRLLWHGFNRGKRLRLAELAAMIRRVGVDADSLAPTPPAGHPDIVLARAVARGVLTGDEAELIAMTRLEHLDMRQLAAAGGYRPNSLWNRRLRAENRLVAWLRTGEVPPPRDPTRIQPIRLRRLPLPLPLPLDPQAKHGDDRRPDPDSAPAPAQAPAGRQSASRRRRPQRCQHREIPAPAPAPTASTLNTSLNPNTTRRERRP